jgi:hypothetical protein
LISLLGGAAGLGASVALLRWLSVWQPFGNFSVHPPVTPDAGVYGVALFLTLLSAGLFGAVPVGQVLRASPYEIVKGGSTARTTKRLSARDVLLVVQISVCAVLITSSLVAVRGLVRSLHGNFGFDPNHSFLVDLRGADVVSASQRRMIDAVDGIPGVESTGLTDALLLTDANPTNVFSDATTDLRVSRVASTPYTFRVSPAYLQTEGTVLLAGRSLTWNDNQNSPRVAVVNREFARKLFHSDIGALGHHFKTGDGTRVEVVAIVEDDMPQTLIDNVIDAFQIVGPQGQNSTLIHMVADRLRNQGLAVEMNHTVSITGQGRQGRIDMAIVDNGIKLGVEVDHLKPRRKSLLKLRSSDTDFRLIVLTHPKAAIATPQQEEGINAIVALQQPDIPDLETSLTAESRDQQPRGAHGTVSSYAALDRIRRLESKVDLRQKGRTPSKEQYVYYVQPEVIAIPPWAYAKRVPELDATADYVWLKSRQLADRLSEMDREESGHPDLMRVQAKRCRACGLLKLNLLAQHRKKLDECAFDGRLLPCGAECLTRRKQRKGEI